MFVSKRKTLFCKTLHGVVNFCVSRYNAKEQKEQRYYNAPNKIITCDVNM